MRIPALYRNNDRDGGEVSETVVWIVEWMIDPQWAQEKDRLMAVVIGPNGIPFMAPAWMLEVLPWEADDTSLKMFRPPSTTGATDKLRPIR